MQLVNTKYCCYTLGSKQLTKHHYLPWNPPFHPVKKKLGGQMQTYQNMTALLNRPTRPVVAPEDLLKNKHKQDPKFRLET